MKKWIKSKIENYLLDKRYDKECCDDCKTYMRHEPGNTDNSRVWASYKGLIPRFLEWVYTYL